MLCIVANVFYTVRNFTTLNAGTGKVEPRNRTDVKRHAESRLSNEVTPNLML